MNRKNLKKLADHLWGLPQDYKGFGMNHLASMEHPHVGLSCAQGHGPAAGIPPLPGEDWANYARRVFGCLEFEPFGWLFGADWAEVDNTTRGAAQRIYYLLEHGVPRDWREQRNGKKPLCYLDQEPTEED